MTTVTPVTGEVSTVGEIVSVVWSKPEKLRHAFLAIACPEEEGGHSIFAANYPGVISQGENLEEAKANIAEAFLGMVESCKKDGKGLQFSPSDTDVAANCIRVWIETDG